MVLHYGQEIFEGLKAYRQPDGSIASFRPDANAARFRASAARLAMARLPDELFLPRSRSWSTSTASGCRRLAARSRCTCGRSCSPPRWASACGRRPSTCTALIASPAGPYFPGGVKPVGVWLCTDYTRAALGGTGTAKCGGNYAASLLAAGPGAPSTAAPRSSTSTPWSSAGSRRWAG